MPRNACSNSPISTTGHSTNQPRDLIQQPLVLDQVEAGGEGEVFRVVEDDALAALGVEHDLRAFQLRHIVVEPLDGNGLRRVEAMAVGDVACADAVDLEIDNFRVRRFRPEGAEYGLQRPHPAQAARLGRGRAPAHRLRPREATDDARHQGGDDLLGGAAGA